MIWLLETHFFRCGLKAALIKNVENAPDGLFDQSVEYVR